MSRRSALLRGARITGGLAGVAIAAGVVASAAVLPLPSVEAEPPSALIRPLPTEQQRVCSGGVVRLGAGGGVDATVAEFVGNPGIVSGTTASDEPQSRSLDAVDVRPGPVAGEPAVLIAPGSEDGVRTLLAGSGSQDVNNGDLVGYSATACAEAGSDSWLVAGSTVVGRTTVVLLSNPSDVTATVDLTVYGEQGAVSAPGADGIAIPAGTQRIVPLSGLAPNLTSPIVRVESRGGQVSATLQQSIVRGLQPGGVEITGPTAGPGLTQIIPGVRVAASVAADAPGDAAGEGAATDPAVPDPAAPATPEVPVTPDEPAATPDAPATPDGPALGENESTGSDTETAIRLFVPGAEDADVTVGVVTEDGSPGGTSFELPVIAGQATDVAFEELEEGLYTVTIESSEPILASARSSTGGGSGSAAVDFSWFVAPVGPVSGEVMVAVPSGPGARLHVTNPGSTPSPIVLSPTSSGEEIRLEIAAESSASVPISAGTVYRLSSPEPVYAQVTFLGDGRFSAFPVNPPNPSASPLRIYP